MHRQMSFCVCDSGSGRRPYRAGADLAEVTMALYSAIARNLCGPLSTDSGTKSGYRRGSKRRKRLKRPQIFCNCPARSSRCAACTFIDVQYLMTAPPRIRFSAAATIFARLPCVDVHRNVVNSFPASATHQCKRRCPSVMNSPLPTEQLLPCSEAFRRTAARIRIQALPRFFIAVTSLAGAGLSKIA